jgi:hypothetical protein
MNARSYNGVAATSAAPALVGTRLSPQPNGNVRYQYRAVTGGAVRERPLCSRSGQTTLRRLWSERTFRTLPAFLLLILVENSKLSELTPQG